MHETATAPPSVMTIPDPHGTRIFPGLCACRVHPPAMALISGFQGLVPHALSACRPALLSSIRMLIVSPYTPSGCDNDGTRNSRTSLKLPGGHTRCPWRATSSAGAVLTLRVVRHTVPYPEPQSPQKQEDIASLWEAPESAMRPGAQGHPPAVHHTPSAMHAHSERVSPLQHPRPPSRRSSAVRASLDAACRCAYTPWHERPHGRR